MTVCGAGLGSARWLACKNTLPPSTHEHYSIKQLLLQHCLLLGLMQPKIKLIKKRDKRTSYLPTKLTETLRLPLTTPTHPHHHRKYFKGIRARSAGQFNHLKNTDPIA